MKKCREDPEVRAAERERNSQRKKLRRADDVFRRAEQTRDTLARRQARQELSSSTCHAFDLLLSP